MASKFGANRQSIRKSNLDTAITDMAAPSPETDKADIQRIAFENRSLANADGATMVLNRQARDELFTRNFRWLDSRDLTSNPDNFFELDEDEIDGLASLILSTGYTDPIIVREVESEGDIILQIIDGERRTLAHRLLGEQVDEIWYMIPARYYPLGTLSDDEARYMLSAQNLGQRNMSESNRMAAFAAVADVLMQQKREGDPKASSKLIKEQLAAQFGCSPRQADMNAHIGRHLIDMGMHMLDDKKITKAAADAIASLSESEQREVLSQIADGSIAKSDAESVARNMSTTRKSSRPKAPVSFDGLIASAIRSLKRADRIGAKAQRKDIASLRDLVDRMDPDRAGSSSE